MRAGLKDVAHRAYTYLARGTLKKMSDKGLWPTLDLDFFKGETKTNIEWPQMYGIHSYPKDEDSSGDGGGGGGGQQAAEGGGGGDGGGGEGKSAEAMVLFLNGQRSHGVVLGIGDRRYRIKGTKQGEVAIYDDQKQQIHLTRDGVHVSVPHGKKITHNIMKEQQSGQGQGGQGGSGGGQTFAEGGSSGGSGSGGSGQQYGQEPWAGKSDQIHSSHTHDKDGYVTKHPGKIEHHIVDEKDHSKIKHSITIDKDGHIQHKAKKYTGTFSDSVNFNKA